VPYQVSAASGVRGPNEETLVKKSQNGRLEPAMKVPEGYSSEVSSVTTVPSGESILFSVPSNHLSPNWYLRVRFMLAVSPSRIGDQPYSFADFRWEQLPEAAKIVQK
jgi:hypothetical protein